MGKGGVVLMAMKKCTSYGEVKVYHLVDYCV